MLGIAIQVMLAVKTRLHMRRDLLHIGAAAGLSGANLLPKI